MVHRPISMQSDSLGHDRLTNGRSPGWESGVAKVWALSTAYLKIFEEAHRLNIMVSCQIQ